MKILSLISFFVLCCVLTSRSQNINNSKTDTLTVPYTYWWQSGGPFIGLCGDPYSLVFTGTVTKINKPETPVTLNGDSSIVLYTPQFCIIEINDIKIKNNPKEAYENSIDKNSMIEKYFKSDCFYSLRLNEGDKVIVFVYSYENEYSIPSNSILKIDNFDDPIVLSIEAYIKNNQDPLSIKADTRIWSKYGLDNALKQIIDCRLSVKNEK
ncbi:MAG: hypothetical protein IPO21_03355 [Bacteroidales bacterium]|nr:hypothetical protein [Bacteroidales bacterium]